MPSKPEQTPAGRMLDIEQVADQLGVPVGTIRFWKAQGDAPKAYKVGRYLRWRQQDIDEWLEGREAS